MSRLIPLTQGQFAIVDETDFDWLMQWKWTAQKTKWGFYAFRRDKRKLVLMHRIINNTPDGMDTDHIDGDRLNNRRSNLRSVTPLQNMMNRRGKRGGTSRFKGVWLDLCAAQKKWRAGIRLDGKLIYLGRFYTEDDAANAYADAALKNFGEYARTTPGEIA